MRALPVYDVEFIPLERRLDDRRVARPDAPLPPGVSADRRKQPGRRPEDRLPEDRLPAAKLKSV